MLASSIEVVAVVTNPDRAAGRGLALRSSPVKVAALEAGVEVLQPERAGDDELRERLEAIDPDVATVVAYGRILPPRLLDVPKLGFVNVHFSLLPDLRGAAPVQHALIDGLGSTGVSIMVLSEGMDEGPVLASEVVAIDHDDTAASLGRRLAVVGARLLVPTLQQLETGSLVAEAQDDAGATYAPKISGAAARVDWSKAPATIRNLVRGLNPEPGAWTTLRSVRVKVLEVVIADQAPAPPPGSLDVGAEVVAGCGGGALVLREVQPAGKRRMSAMEWARGLRLEPGERFE